ncbi:hypothetical protein [Pseudomonas aeruginosa]|uniref:hypothetical protein n=1 Tax=Pseudomonas aeruginosa TaxID=287 RepID=UPI0021F0B7E2|nr:hypothetical protein [Pseudomonas aeruginosa]MCV6454947.1 hypothetical protein [Pseudomonas aeruginosa]
MANMYTGFFRDAIRRTRNLGFDLPAVQLRRDHTHVDSAFLGNDLGQLIFDTFGRLSMDDISAQCVRLHSGLLAPVKDHFKCQAYLTIGSVKDGDHYYYDLNEQKIEELLRSGLESTFPFHCWITLDTLEIIDISFATTYAMSREEWDKVGEALAIHPDNLKTSGVTIEYVPMLIGDPFLNCIGIDCLSGITLASQRNYIKPSWLKTKILNPLLSFSDKT